MANVQLENGFTQIANELLEAVIRTYMSNYEHRIFWLIVRKTYGYNKKSDWIAQKQIVEITGILKQHVSRTIKKLRDKNMIVVIDKKLAIQKDYDLWELPKQVTKESNLNGLQKVTDSGNKVTQMGVKSNPNGGTQKNTTIQKTYIQDIFNYWNLKKIITHKQMTTAMSSKIQGTINNGYTADEIKESILNYKAILDGEEYYFKYKWTLPEFLQRGFEKFKDWDVCSENYTIKEDKWKKN